MTPNITTSEVLELYGIQRSQLKVWMKEGLRAAGKRRVNGGMTHVFDPAKLAHWCAAHGKKPKGIEGAALKAAALDPVPAPSKESAPARRIIDPPAQPIPDGSVIRAAREAAGLNLRDFARRMDGRDAVLHGKEAPKPSFKTWSLIETGQRTERSGRIPEAVWNRVRDFVAQHGPKADLSHDGSESVT